MALPPARTELVDTYPNPSTGVFKGGIGKFYDYVKALLGATGDQREARDGLGIPAVGQCELTTSGANLVLLPRDGNLICIDGFNRPIPNAGVTLAPTGTAASTDYNIYAYWTGSAVALERDTASHVLGSYGVRVKSTDATRTLVGKAGTLTAGAWVNTAGARYVLSWFNRRLVKTSTTLASTLTVNLTTAQPLTSVGFLSWGNETISASLAGGMQNNTAAAVNFISIWLDSNSSFSTPSSYGQAAVNNGYSSFTQTYPIEVATEGRHTLTAMGWVNSGTGSFLAGSGIAASVSG